MRRGFVIIVALLWLLSSADAKKMTADDVINTIIRVNTYWQTNNKAEVRAFWDHAAYHTGNMEVVRLLKEDQKGKMADVRQQFLDYSLRWANHNQWQGATEKDTSKWKYKRYGEGQDFVLFGDWQICFQTYIDLYLLDRQEERG